MCIDGLCIMCCMANNAGVKAHSMDLRTVYVTESGEQSRYSNSKLEIKRPVLRYHVSMVQLFNDFSNSAVSLQNVFKMF